MTTYNVTLTVGLTLGQTFRQKNLVSLTDAAKFGGVKPFASRGIRIVQGIGVHAASTPKWTWGRAIVTGVKFNSPLTAKAHYSVVVTQGTGFDGSVSHIIPITLTQIIGLTSSIKVVRSMTIVQGFATRATLAGAARYHSVITQLAFFRTPAPHAAHGRSITVGLLLHPVISRQYVGVSKLSQGLGIADSHAHAGVYSMLVVDRPGFTDAQIVHGIYKGALADAICMWASYVDPGSPSDVTTWAINTRTGAVTEYENYAFNSMCRMGSKFIGATSSALWELDGELDGADAITTATRNGNMQMGGSKFTQLDGIYLGIRAKDDAKDFFLKIYTGDGRMMVYAVKINDQQTTKINIGKGLRARYISFELDTSGADFDLDTIEFVPVISKRRI